jgi:hypothetical protein
MQVGQVAHVGNASLELPGDRIGAARLAPHGNSPSRSRQQQTREFDVDATLLTRTAHWQRLFVATKSSESAPEPIRHVGRNFTCMGNARNPRLLRDTIDRQTATRSQFGNYVGPAIFYWISSFRPLSQTRATPESLNTRIR